METLLQSPSMWGVLQFVIFILIAALAYYYRRVDKDRDLALKQIHEDMKTGADRLNALSDEFIRVSTQHEEGYPLHKECIEKLGRIETRLEICDHLKSKGGK